MVFQNVKCWDLWTLGCSSRCKYAFSVLKVSDNGSRIYVDQVIRGEALTEHSREMVLPFDQQNVALLEDLVQKFAKYDKLDLDVFVGMLSREKARQPRGEQGDL